MQVNRLNHLFFPPATPSLNAGLLDATEPEAQDTASGSGTAAAATRSNHAAAIAQKPQPSGQVPEASVKLELDQRQRTQAPITYGPDGIFAGKSRVEMANTPAERFVATAVDIMRTYAQDPAQPATQGPLDRIKQAMSRFSAQA